jgi:hypothetical protein
VRNEFSVFESNLTQGYIYTINPPSIFSNYIGVYNTKILNRLQAIALRSYKNELKNLKMIGFDDYSDTSIIKLYKIIFKDVIIFSKNCILDEKDNYSIEEDYALIIHNNR